MSYCLFISSPHVQHMTSQNLLILIDFDGGFDHFFYLQPTHPLAIITLDLEKILRNGKRRSS